MKTMMASVALAASSLLGSHAWAQGAVPRAELTDPLGDVNEFNGKGNSLDVVKLTLDSDGANLLVSATLGAEPGRLAGAAVDLYIDTDNDPKTGGKTEWGPAGFEHRAEVGICIVDASGRTCTGVSDKPIKLKHSATMVETFKGTAGQEMEGATLQMTVNHLQSPETPLQARLVTDKIRYADLGVKKGQVIRIVARESDGKGEEKSLFPDVLLKLN